MADDGAGEEKTPQGTTARGGQPRQAARRRGQPDRGKARDGERRRTSLPVVTMPVRLNSEAALALVRRPLGNTLFDIALMDMVVPRFTGEREVAELRQLLIDAIATARVEIAQAIERAEGQKRKAGCKLAVSYSDPREVTLQVGSPIAMKLPELLQQLDRGVAEIDALWLAGEITHGAREQEVRRLAQPLEQLGDDHAAIDVGEADIEAEKAFLCTEIYKRDTIIRTATITAFNRHSSRLAPVG